MFSSPEVPMKPRRSLRTASALALAILALAAAAQPPSPAPPPPRSARESALADLTGHWVAQITEDWRWRMVTPPKGDYASVPLNPAGRAVADSWDLANDVAAGAQCRAFGAGGIMRQPTRLRIAWADDDTLRVEADAGEQTRLFRFGTAHEPRPERTWQGDSAAEWLGPPPAAGMFGFGTAVPTGFRQAAPNDAQAARGNDAGPGARDGAPSAAPARARGAAASAAAAGARARDGGPSSGGSLKVVTTNLRAGYLRKNGVLYSEDAVITEYWDRVSMFGNDYLQVVVVVDDPTYLTAPFVVSSHFKREPDDSKWNPTPCATDPPIGTFQPSPFVP
jgi:hypothetical protein